MRVKRYFNGSSAGAAIKRMLRESNVSFGPSFTSAYRFWLAANSIWATLIVAACVAVALRLRIDKSWVFITFFIVLTAGLILRELRKTPLGLKTLLILILGMASTGFLLWPC